MIKTLKKLGIEEMYFNVIKTMHYKLTANITLSGEKLKAFPITSGARQRYPYLPHPANIILKVLVSNYSRKKK